MSRPGQIGPGVSTATALILGVPRHRQHLCGRTILATVMSECDVVAPRHRATAGLPTDLVRISIIYINTPTFDIRSPGATFKTGVFRIDRLTVVTVHSIYTEIRSVNNISRERHEDRVTFRDLNANYQVGGRIWSHCGTGRRARF